MAHFLEHLTFKGTAAFPTTRALSEAVEGVGGSFNAATDREATVYWVRVPRRETERAMHGARRADLPAGPRPGQRSTGSARSSSRRSAATSTTPPSTPRSSSSRRCSGRPLGREICGEESDVRAFRPAHPRVLGGHLPARERGGRRRRRHRARRRRSSWPGRHSGGGTARPWVRTRPVAARGRAGHDGQARHHAGAALRRRARAPARPSRCVGALGPQRDPRRRDEQPPLPHGWTAMRSRTTSARGSSSTPTRARSRSPRGSIRGESGRRSTRSCASSRRFGTSGPGDELHKAKALPLRRPRAADGGDPPPRIVDRRPGGAPRAGPHAR